MSTVSSRWYKTASSNKVWQFQYARLKRHFRLFSSKQKELLDPLHPGTGKPAWPLSKPQRDYYKVVCAILIFFAKNAKPKRTPKRAVSWTSETLSRTVSDRRSGSLNMSTSAPQLPYLRVNKILFRKGCSSRRLTCAAMGAKYGLEEADLDRPWLKFMKQDLSHQRKQKGRQFYNEAEIQLIAILKWGSLNARKQQCGR
eukprot:TRINITY_DN4460_c0_g2_i3.p1 TRINITY_DN4460_c0_g2~~TRINITY_DN4460_c0_g2_i3.p1  ORF type:complete len:199 (-),score=5.44 TRINITY_DN4460_c0_g2_i3:107-703(-)